MPRRRGQTFDLGLRVEGQSRGPNVEVEAEAEAEAEAEDSALRTKPMYTGLDFSLRIRANILHASMPVIV